jgi:hypothetical protein
MVRRQKRDYERAGTTVVELRHRTMILAGSNKTASLNVTYEEEDF